MSNIKKIVLTSVLLTSAIFVCLYFYLFLNKEKIIRSVINDIEQSLDVKVDTKKIHIFIKTQPWGVGISLHDNTICDKKSRHNIVKTKEIYCRFRLWKLIRGICVLDSLKISNGKIVINAFEPPLFNIKQDFEQGGIRLKSIYLHNVELDIYDKKKQYRCNIFIKNLETNLGYKNRYIDGNTIGELMLKNILINNICHFKHCNANINLKHTYNSVLQKISLKPSSALIFNSIPLKLEGDFAFKTGPARANLLASKTSAAKKADFKKKIFSKKSNNKLNFIITSKHEINIKKFLMKKSQKNDAKHEDKTPYMRVSKTPKFIDKNSPEIDKKLLYNKGGNSPYIHVIENIKNIFEPYVKKGKCSMKLFFKDIILKPSLQCKLFFPKAVLIHNSISKTLNIKNALIYLDIPDLSNSSTAKIKIDSKNNSIGKWNFLIQGTIMDLDKLDTKIDIEGVGDLAEYYMFLKNKQFNDIRLKGNISYKLTLKAFLLSLFRDKKGILPIIDGDIYLDDVKFKYMGFVLNKISGHIPMKNNNIKNASVKAFFNKNNISAKISIRELVGRISKILGYSILDTLHTPVYKNSSKFDKKVSHNKRDRSPSYESRSKKIELDMDIISDKLIVPRKSILKHVNVKKNDVPNNFEFQHTLFSDILKNINARLSFKVDNLNINKLHAQDCFLKARIFNSTLFFDCLSLKTCGGKLTLEGFFETLDLYSVFKGKGKITRMYINEVLESFNNFDQQFITAKNIRGELYSNFDFNLKFFGLKIMWNTLISNIELYFKNALLYNFAPLLYLKKYFSEDMLKKIYFEQTIKNVLHIEKSKIHISNILLKSSIMDVMISGWHSFDNNIDYKFVLPLKGNFTIDKKKKNKKKSSATLKAFVTLKGPANNPKVRFNIKNMILDTIKKQGKDLGKIITGRYKAENKIGDLEDDYFEF